MQTPPGLAPRRAHRRLPISPLGQRLVLVVVLSSSAIALLITLDDARGHYRAGLRQLAAAQAQIEQIHADVIRDHLWTLNDDAARNTVRALARLDHIDHVELTWENGDLLAAGESLDGPSLKRAITLGLSRDGRHHVLGALRLESSLEPLREAVLAGLGWTFIANSLKSLVVSAVVLFCFHRLVSAHIRHLVSALGAVAADERIPPVRLHRPHREDELQALVDAYNALGGRLNVAYAALNQRQAVLAAEVAERTEHLALAHQRLMQKSRLETIGLLSAMVAHEIRNPLGAIRASQLLLQRRVAGDAVNRRSLARIDRALLRCDQTVDRLRQIAHQRSGEFERRCLGAWLDRFLDANPALGEGVELVRAIERPLLCRFDAVLLGLCLRDVLENAMHAVAARRPGRRRIELIARRTPRGLMVCVSDSGPGLDEASIRRALDPLYSTKVSGFGMGLALAERLIAEHGGKLTIDRSPALGGARVRLCLPPTSPRQSLRAQPATRGRTVPPRQACH